MTGSSVCNTHIPPGHCVKMHVVYTILDLILLLIGLILILWGNKIYKAYIITLGMAIGGCVGFILGLTLSFIEPNFARIIIATPAILFAVIGGLIALPLQKFVVFIAFGSLGALLITLTLIATQPPIDKIYLLLAAILFIACGIIGIRYFEYAVLFLMASTGCYLISILITNQGSLLHDLISSIFNIGGKGMTIAGFGATWIRILCVAIFIPFAFIYQKMDRLSKTNIKSTVPAFLCIYILAWLTVRFNVADTKALHTLIGFNLLGWPIVSIIILVFANWLVRKIPDNPKSRKPAILRYIAIVLFGLTIVPAIGYIFYALINMHFVEIEYYEAFWYSTNPTRLIKLSFSLLLLPYIALKLTPCRNLP